MIDRNVNAVCAMKPVTGTTGGSWRKGNQFHFVPKVCDQRVVKVIHGVPLCWTHAASVEAGVRPLPVVAWRSLG